MEEEEFKKIQDFFMGPSIGWSYTSDVLIGNTEDTGVWLDTTLSKNTPGTQEYFEDLKNMYFEKRKNNINNSFYMTHMIYFHPNGVLSPAYNVILPLLAKMNISALHRIKANLFPNQGKQDVHPPHADLSYTHDGAIFSINTNDGYTLLKDGTKVKSVANRLLLFDPSLKHSSTTPTDTKVRVNINFNYYKIPEKENIK